MYNSYFKYILCKATSTPERRSSVHRLISDFLFRKFMLRFFVIMSFSLVFSKGFASFRPARCNARMTRMLSMQGNYIY